MKLLIVNGIAWYRNRLQPLDIAIQDGVILSVGKAPEGFLADKILDAQRGFVLPGFIDLHTHLDDYIGPHYLADTFYSGTQNAVCNGITTLYNFVTQRSEETLDEAVACVHRKAAGNCWCHYGLHLTPTRFLPEDWEDILQKVEQGYRTFKFYTTYRNAGLYCDYETLEAIIGRLSSTGVCFMIHGEDDGILQSVSTKGTDFTEPFSHTLLRPPAAEVQAIRRLLELAVRTKASLHLVHVSTYEGAQLIQQARQPAAVTCETAPHYLFLDEEYLNRAEGHRWLCSPPLRCPHNRLQMIEAARMNWFDILATDHCPFTREDKDSGSEDIRLVPNGVAGIGALSHLAAALWDWPSPVAVPHMVRTLAENPARIAGLFPRKGILTSGADADIVIIGPLETKQPIVSSFADCYETYPDHQKVLDILSVVVGGKEVVHHNRLLPEITPQGKWVSAS